MHTRLRPLSRAMLWCAGIAIVLFFLSFIRFWPWLRLVCLVAAMLAVLVMLMCGIARDIRRLWRS